MNELEEKIKHFYISDLQFLPYRKIKIIVNDFSLLQRAFDKITHYGIELSDVIYKCFYNVVSSILSGSKEIEYEWTENEYNNIEKLKLLYK